MTPLPVEPTEQTKGKPVAQWRPRNRLAIGHLLLWTAATAVVLTYQQSHKPGPTELVAWENVFSQSPEAERTRAYYVGLLGTPIFGAGLAAAGLTLWGLVTRQFGFPVQAGHWLLLLVAEIGLGLAATPLVPPSMISDGPAWAVFNFAIALSIGAIVAVGGLQPGWRLACAFLAAACLSMAICCALYPFDFFSVTLFALGGGLFLVVLFLITATICSIVDAARYRNFDVFHWIGIASIFSYEIYFLANVVQEFV